MKRILDKLEPLMPYIGTISKDHLSDKVFIVFNDDEYLQERFGYDFFIDDTMFPNKYYYITVKKNSINVSYKNIINFMIYRYNITYNGNKFSPDELEVALFEMEMDYKNETA